MNGGSTPHLREPLIVGGSTDIIRMAVNGNIEMIEIWNGV